MNTIFVSILNFNSRDFTYACLSSLGQSRLSDSTLTVLVRDNASEEKLSVDEKQYTSLSLKVVYGKINEGFAGGHNANIQYALEHGASHILLLNNDATIAKDTIQELLNSFSDDTKVGAVVPKIYFAKGHEFHKEQYKESELGKVIWYAGGKMDWRNVIGKNRGVDEVDQGQYDTRQKTELLTGCCVLIKREVFEKIGLFDERYFLYYEDSDFTERMKKKYTLVYAPKAIAWHANASSSGGSGSELQDYYISRNRLLFGMKYASMRTRIALLRESTRLLFNGRTWQKQGIKDYYKKKFGKGSYSL